MIDESESYSWDVPANQRGVLSLLVDTGVDSPTQPNNWAVGPYEKRQNIFPAMVFPDSFFDHGGSDVCRISTPQPTGATDRFQRVVRPPIGVFQLTVGVGIGRTRLGVSGVAIPKRDQLL